MTSVGHDAARAETAAQLRDQAAACERLGSPLYALLLEEAAADVAAGGVCWEVLGRHAAGGRGDALALRFLAAVHRLVLLGRAPRLARHYPSAGGHTGVPGVWSAFVGAVEEHADELRELVGLPCQTNEVGRCAALLGGFLAAAAETRLPLRLLEAGASAGLNLRWDHYRYEADGRAWGDAGSPVRIRGEWDVPAPLLGVEPAVAERRGCDPSPVDPTTPDGRLTLTASVWADQRERHERLRAALDVAAAVPAMVERGSADTWLAPRLRERAEGHCTVVFHSVVEEYLAPDVRAAFVAVLDEHGRAATRDAPLAWLRMEPPPDARGKAADRRTRAMEVRLRLWPGGDDVLLADAGGHGLPVRWRGVAPAGSPGRPGLCDSG